MKSKYVGLFVIVFICTAIFLFFWQRYHWNDIEIRIGEQKLNVLVAQSIYQQYRGLGKRETIEPYDGMLFPHSLLGKHAIVMREMRFPIDVVWLKNSEVIDFRENILPQINGTEETYIRYQPQYDSNLTLELPAGSVANYNITVGSHIEIVE